MRDGTEFSFREPLNAGPSCVRSCAGLHNASGTQSQKPHNTRKPKHTKNHTKNQLRRTPKRKTPAQQQQSTHSKQAPSTKSSIRVYQSTGVSEHQSRAPARTKDDEGWPENRQQHSSPHSRAHKQLPARAAMFAEVIVPGKKEKRTRYCTCSLQELGLVMCARTVGLYATADVFFGHVRRSDGAL